MDIIKNAEAGISHCPVSNTCLESGIMQTKKYLNQNIKVALGSDIAGGYTANMLQVMRECIGVSKLLQFQENINYESNITLEEAFYLATLGGANLLGIDDKIGNLQEGKYFDALLINLKNGFTFNYNNTNTLSEIFEKFIYLGDDRNIIRVFVKGKNIKI